jgi:hypothetical protein
MTLTELAEQWRKASEETGPTYEASRAYEICADELEDWAKYHGRFVPPDVLVAIGKVTGFYREFHAPTEDVRTSLQTIERWLDT